MASINIEQQYGARGLYNGRYVSPDTPGQSRHAMNTLGGNRDGVSKAICELTLPSALIPRCLLTSALIHCAGQDQSCEKLQLSQIRAPWVCVALGLSNSRRQQITVCVNHNLTLRSYQQTAQDCQSWLLVCVCLCEAEQKHVQHSKQFSLTLLWLILRFSHLSEFANCQAWTALCK